MVLDVYSDNINDSKNRFFKADSIELQKIICHLDLSHLCYVSQNIQTLLDIEVSNDSKYFEIKNQSKFLKKDEKYKVILYIRLSVEDGDLENGDVSGSIKNQLLFLLDECEKRNWEVVGIFCEEDISGVLSDRPEWNKSLKFCENGYTEIILCKSQSRFTRELETVEKYLHNKFIEWGIRFVSIVDNADTSNAANKKSRQINGLVNEWQVEDQSNNIRAILKNKQSNGLFTGSFAAYGYVKDPRDKYHLIIDEGAAQVVRKIFDMYLSGVGVCTICNFLNKKRIPIPSIYKAQQGLKYHNSLIELNKRVKYKVEDNETLQDIADKYKANIDEIIEYNHLKEKSVEPGQIIIIPIRPVWRTTTIYHILKDEIYIGTLVQHKNEIISYKNKKERKIPEEERIKVAHCHQPIIDMNTWEGVQKRILINGRERKCKNGDIAIFSKKIYCASCGHSFYRNKAKVKKGIIYYWSCGAIPATGNYLCSNRKVIREEYLYDYILNEINKQIKKYYDEILVEKKYYELKVTSKLENEKSALKKELLDIENKINKKESISEVLYEDRVNGSITIEEFRTLKDKNDIAISNLKKRATIINDELNEFENKRKNQIAKENLFKKYKKLESLDRVIVNEFISKINIGNYDKTTKTRKISIDWNI